MSAAGTAHRTVTIAPRARRISALEFPCDDSDAREDPLQQVQHRDTREERKCGAEARIPDRKGIADERSGHGPQDGDDRPAGKADFFAHEVDFVELWFLPFLRLALFLRHGGLQEGRLYYTFGTRVTGWSS